MVRGVVIGRADANPLDLERTPGARIGTMTGSISPGQAAEHSGFSLDTLRYYERIGLLSPVDRAPSGHRRFTPDDLEWLAVLRCLRDTGMPIARDAAATPSSPGAVEPTLADRLALLIEHDAAGQGAHRRAAGRAGAPAGEDQLVPRPRSPPPTDGERDARAGYPEQQQRAGDVGGPGQRVRQREVGVAGGDQRQAKRDGERAQPARQARARRRRARPRPPPARAS